MVLMVIGVGLMLGSMIAGDEPGPKEVNQLAIQAYNKEAKRLGNKTPEMTLEEYQVSEKERVMVGVLAATSKNVNYGFFLIVLTGICWLIFWIVGRVKDPTGWLKMAIWIGGFGLLFIILYYALKIEAQAIPETVIDGLKNEDNWSVDGYNVATWGITTTLLLLAGAVLSIIFGSIYNLIKK
jgi:hypothetical protein